MVPHAAPIFGRAARTPPWPHGVAWCTLLRISSPPLPHSHLLPFPCSPWLSRCTRHLLADNCVVRAECSRPSWSGLRLSPCEVPVIPCCVDYDCCDFWLWLGRTWLDCCKRIDLIAYGLVLWQECRFRKVQYIISFNSWVGTMSSWLGLCLNSLLYNHDFHLIFSITNHDISVYMYISLFDRMVCLLVLHSDYLLCAMFNWISIVLGRWITFLVAQVVALANLKKSLGLSNSGLLVILPLCNLWMFLRTPRFIAAMHLMVFLFRYQLYWWLTVLFITSSTCIAPPRCPAHLWMGNQIRGSPLTTNVPPRTLHHRNHRGPQRRKICLGEDWHSPKRRT